ncbi:hypothetical protein TCAL_16908 [Tigriopus californicus]|uniref:Uncharacterized protein n=1 Tax=Tigriopus californicus TaxID=6832 RepID=A0A553P8B2_TIGCA|nr:hypothetical protein TCAL_16908 [Tigriopus californicus]
MGKDQELIEAARSGNYPGCEKILSAKPKKAGPFARCHFRRSFVVPFSNLMNEPTNPHFPIELDLFLTPDDFSV